MYLGVPQSKELVSFKLSCIEDPVLLKSLNGKQGAQTKFDAQKLANDFFKTKEKVCMVRVQPNTFKF